MLFLTLLYLNFFANFACFAGNYLFVRSHKNNNPHFVTTFTTQMFFGVK